MRKKIEFTEITALNNKLNLLFKKLKRPRIRKWYAIIGKDVYHVTKSPFFTMNNPKIRYKWFVNKSLFFSNNSLNVKNYLKKGKDVTGSKVHVSF